MQNADTNANKPPPAKGAVSFHDDKSGRDVTGIPVYNKATGKWELQELGGAIPKPAAGGAANNKTGMAAFDPALDASGRLKIMQDAAANPNAQNDMALLFNHIGMTLSAQKGARITNAEIERAIKARSLPGDIQAMYQKVQNGQFLTPEQRAQMVQLGVDNRKIIWEKARSKAKFYGVTSEPGDLSGLPPVENTSSFQLNGKTYNIPSAEVEEFLKDNPSAKRQ